MRPSEKLAKVVRYIKLGASIVGADVIDKNFKPNSVTYLVMVFIVGYFTCLGFTIVMKISSNLIYCLETVCMGGVAVQGVSKLASALVHSTKFWLQYELLESIYLKYEDKGKGYTLILNRCITRFQIAFQIIMCLYILAAMALISMPFIYLIITAQRVLPLQFLLPLFDVDTDFGYFGTIGVHIICVIFGCAGNFASDTLMLMYFANCMLFVDIFELKADELNKVAMDSGNQNVGEKLKDVIEWHQMYSQFIEDNDRIFWWSNFVQIVSSGLSIALTMVLIFISDWPGPYIYIWLAFSMMYLYCGMGTLVEVTNDRFIDEVYAIQWYLLTTSQQKAVQFMLMKSQSPKQITIGGFAPLSVSTGLQVTKTVYSFFMMMLNFFN